MSAVTWREQAVDQERAGLVMEESARFSSWLTPGAPQRHLHGVGELLRSFGLLREHRMRRLSDGDAA